jgi:phosphonate transport system substrate-binding protein
MKKARFTAIALVSLMLAMLLAACGATATPTAAPAPTTAAAPAATTAASTAATTAPATTSAKLSLSKVRLGFIPAENATKVIEQAQPFIDALSKELGVPVELTVGTNFTATIEALASKKIDVAWFGPFSYVLAADKYNAEAILMQLGKNGATSYKSMIFANPKSGIKTIADLKGKSFSFVDPASTSGNLIPRYTLTKAGLDPDKDVQGTFAGTHDVSILGVSSGKTDAGAVASDIFEKLISEGKIKESELVKVAESAPIPNSPIAVYKDMNPNDKKIIADAFLKLKDPKVLQSIIAEGFIPTTDSTYNVLRDIAKTLNLDLTKLK